MEEQQDFSTSIRDIWKFVLAILGAVAIFQELRKPKDERTWHGTVAGFVPYEYRVPSFNRIKDVYWNPDGKLFGSKVFGVGWAVNLGKVAGFLSDDAEETAEGPVEA